MSTYEFRESTVQPVTSRNGNNWLFYSPSLEKAENMVVRASPHSPGHVLSCSLELSDSVVMCFWLQVILKFKEFMDYLI